MAHESGRFLDTLQLKTDTAFSELIHLHDLMYAILDITGEYRCDRVGDIDS
jgi:hypothetical protein